jgi:hypothetical protein
MIIPAVFGYSVVTVSQISDDIPDDISIFAIPQVIQVVYPVKGCIMTVFAVPQLINTVYIDG